MSDRAGGIQPAWRSRPDWILPSLLMLSVVVVVPVIAALAGAGVPFRNDFAAYWPVGRLLLGGQNPYDAAAIEALQRSVGDTLGGDSIVRYPPWTLPVLVPLGLLPYAPGWYMWITLQTLLVGSCSIWLWRLLGGRGSAGLPLIVAFGFPAGLFVALGGQIDGVLLLGVTVYLWAIQDRRDTVAGICLGVLTLKPHLFLPLGLVVLLWAARERRWKIPAAAMVSIITGAVCVMALRPPIFADYLELLQAPGTSWQRAVALGTGLSRVLDEPAPWLQWLPAAVVTVIVLVRWNHHSGRFDWRRDLPVLLGLGLVAAPYLLVHDLVILVPALLTVALCVVDWPSAGGRWLAAVLFAVFCIVVWIGQIAEATLFIHVWIAPFVLFLAIPGRNCVRPATPEE